MTAPIHMLPVVGEDGETSFVPATPEYTLPAIAAPPAPPGQFCLICGLPERHSFVGCLSGRGTQPLKLSGAQTPARR